MTNRIFSKDELRELMKDTVHETLKGLGVDVDRPTEMQHDLAYLREFRTYTSAMVKRALVTAVGALVTGGLALLLLGIRSYLG